MSASPSTIPTPTLEHVRAFAEDPKTVSLQAKVLVARAHAQVTREHVNGYTLAAFAEWTFMDDEGGRITDPDRLYRALDTDEAKCAEWYNHCRILHAANGYTVKPGYCPALIAESELSDAEHALLTHAGKAFGMPGLATSYGELRKRALDLYMRQIRV